MALATDHACETLRTSPAPLSIRIEGPAICKRGPAVGDYVAQAGDIATQASLGTCQDSAGLLEYRIP